METGERPRRKRRRSYTGRIWRFVVVASRALAAAALFVLAVAFITAALHALAAVGVID